MNMDETILFIGGGVETLPGVKIAKSMNLRVVVSDKNPDAPCSKVADHLICADTYNIESTLKAVDRFIVDFGRLDAVICMATDVPLTVASVADKLGICGIPILAARTVSDKIMMKDCFKAHNLPIPWYSVIKNFEHLKSVVNQKGFPLIIKPVDSRGARGVLRLLEGIDFFKPKEKKPIMLENLRNIFYKMELSSKETRILSSVFASLGKKR